MTNERKISFGAAVLMVVNIIVGGGILALPAQMTLFSGTSSFLGWIVVAILLFPIMWSVAQASTLFPGGSGFLHYGQSGLGPMAGFVAQWGYLLGYMGTISTLTFLLFNNVVKQFSISMHPLAFIIPVIVIISLLNLINIKVISRLQSGATLLKLIPLFIVIGVFMFYWNPAITYQTKDMLSLGLTIPIAMFGYWGFESACSIGHLLKDGPEQVGKIILTAFSLVVAIYALFHLGLIHIMGASALSQYGPIAFPAYMGLSSNLTALLQSIIVAAILLSLCNSLFGIALTNVSNFELLGQRNLLWQSKNLLTLNSNQRPWRLVVFHALLWLTLVIAISDVQILASLTNLGVILAFFITLLAVMNTFYKKEKFLPAAITFVGLLSCSVLLYFSWMSLGTDTVTRLLYASPVAVGLCFGLVMYKSLKSRQ